MGSTPLCCSLPRAYGLSSPGQIPRHTAGKRQFLIYYAGHGVLEAETDTGFWLPVDAEADNEGEWIEVGAIARNAKAMAAHHVMLVADSCYSGTLAHHLTGC